MKTVVYYYYYTRIIECCIKGKIERSFSAL